MERTREGLMEAARKRSAATRPGKPLKKTARTAAGPSSVVPVVETSEGRNVVRIPSDRSRDRSREAVAAAAGSSDPPPVPAEEIFIPAWGIRTTDSLVGSTRASYDFVMHMRPPADVALANTHSNTSLVRSACNSFGMLGCYAATAFSRLEEMTTILDSLKEKNSRLREQRREEREALSLAQDQVAHARQVLQEQSDENCRLKEQVALSQRQADENCSLKQQIAFLQQQQTELKKSAVDEYKASPSFDQELIDYGSAAFVEGFDICKAEVGKLFPEVDLGLLVIPGGGGSDADKGDGSAA